MAGPKVSALVLMAIAGLALAGCENGAQPFHLFGKGKEATDSAAADGSADATAPQESSVKLVDRDVEAPDVFQVTAKGLWDGRPSLGGVWAAYPGVKDPERVIIRNPKNGKFVIGALFRREINNPGPKLQLSSDAATALGLLAGEPAMVSVTALRREEAPVQEPNAKKPVVDSNEQVKTKPITDVPATAAKTPPAKTPVENVAAGASAAIAKAESKTKIKKPAARPEKIAAATKQSSTPKPVAKPPPAPQKTASAKPATGARSYLQIGIFSLQANANRAADMMSKAGALVQIKAETSQGKKFWRVEAGPATSKAQREALLKTAKKLGFADAYYVTR